ncbi:Glycosyl transferase family 2 [Pseudobutyrivibrio sp. OR37]|uniref:glycosyltransferase family 2 protein n=1 Tax=Pseudobutyrivibrio sp. OR37 TaxID=1798186 RepID=UPI0008E8B4C1|nr:glycosyltransferase family 2 protein [Pseudobutyrivibrio sp. OR37]SFI04021.1 Glycosyl transferase family 2 [Pseudobutyrivibrio sp. OR37]
MGNNLVSILTPCYNGANYVKYYLDSILAQTYDYIELIFIDDASTDNTFEIVKEYEKKFNVRGYKLIYKKLEKNMGQAAAINVALHCFSGDYMMWMDADDIFLPEAIEKKVNYLCENESIDFVLNWGVIVDENNRDKSIRLLKRMERNDDNLFKDLIDNKNVVFCPGTIFVKTSSLKKAIPNMNIYESREGQNYQLMLPLAYNCKYGYIDEVLFKYVLRKSSHSHYHRDFSAMNDRIDNFEKMICLTIENISAMPQEEKQYWIQYVKKQTIYNRYVNSIESKKYMSYREYKKQLLDSGFKLGFFEKYYTWYIFRIQRYIKRRIGL